MNVYNAQNCTFVETQHVEKMEVQTMHVQSQTVKDNAESDTSAEDSLLAVHIHDREVRKLIISALKSCRKNGQTAPMVMQILKEHDCWNSKLISREFAAALLPHLTYETTTEALYLAFYRL